LKLVLTIAAILLIAGFAQAATLTVCPIGCDYTSIQTAVYAAHPNDTIEVHSGTYNESVVLTKDITFNGTDTGSGEPIVNGDLYKNGFNSALRGFSFQSISSGIPYPENMATPNTTLYWIEKAFENPSTPKAIAALNTITKTNPKDAWAWFRLGWVLYNSERYDESLSAYNESMKLDPYYSSLWNERGNDFYLLRKYNQALEAFEKSIQIEPNNGLYWDSKGDTLEALGRINESDEAYAEAEDLGYYTG
jgi:tetratricopeptide (TPR) repeat protein